MRRFLWVLGATLILALVPLTGHIAFAAEHPRTGVTGTSATADNSNLAEATTDPASVTAPDRANRHDATDAASSDGSAPAGGETHSDRTSRHAADDGSAPNAPDTTDPAANQDHGGGHDRTSADSGDQAGDPAPAPNPSATTGDEQVAGAEPSSAPVAIGNSPAGSASAPAAALPASSAAPAEPSPEPSQRQGAPAAVTPAPADTAPADPTPEATAAAPVEQSSAHPPHPGHAAGAIAGDLAVVATTGPSPSLANLCQGGVKSCDEPVTVLPAGKLDLGRLIARLTQHGLCVAGSSEPGDVSCGGGTIQLCLRATAAGISLSCASPAPSPSHQTTTGGGTEPGGTGDPVASNPPPVTQPTGGQPGGAPDAEIGTTPRPAPLALAPDPDTSSLAGAISEPVTLLAMGTARSDPAALAQPTAFVAAGHGGSMSTSTGIATLPGAPTMGARWDVSALRTMGKAIRLADLIQPARTDTPHLNFAPKLTVLGLVDHISWLPVSRYLIVPRRPQSPGLMAPRLQTLNPFAGLAVFAMPGGSQTVSQANAGRVQPIAGAASTTGDKTLGAPGSQAGQPPNGTRGQPVGIGGGALPNSDDPSPVTPLRLLLVLLASGCFATAAMTRTRWKRHRLRT